ncbi:MAG: hypothetical protein L0Y62_04720 [Nitrospirae bacterium]|nr:hypothetical protein [Nitrospirota bacterium]
MKWFILVAAAFIAQAQFAVFNISLNLVMLPCYIFSLRKASFRMDIIQSGWTGRYTGIGAEAKGAVFGAVIGILEDILNGSLVGPSMFSKGIIGFLSAVEFSERFFKWTPLLGGVSIAFFSIIDGSISTGMRLLFGSTIISGAGVLQIVFMQAIVNAPFGVILKPPAAGQNV